MCEQKRASWAGPKAIIKRVGASNGRGVGRVTRRWRARETRAGAKGRAGGGRGQRAANLNPQECDEDSRNSDSISSLRTWTTQQGPGARVVSGHISCGEHSGGVFRISHFLKEADSSQRISIMRHKTLAVQEIGWPYTVIAAHRRQPCREQAVSRPGGDACRSHNTCAVRRRWSCTRRRIL